MIAVGDALLNRAKGHPGACRQRTMVRRNPLIDRGFGRQIGFLILLVEGRFGLVFPDFETAFGEDAHISCPEPAAARQI